jgi:hypothetical protein
MQIKHNMIKYFGKYKFFYVNGCSHTEGGGLEEENISMGSVIPKYKTLYGISWKNRTEVNYGKRLEEIIGIKCINDALSGSGIDRVVRTTYDFILKNWKDKDKFFIILEKPDSSRSDVFYTKTNKYYIVNSNFRNQSKLEFLNATIEYYNKKYPEDIETFSVFQNWFNNHYSFEEKLMQDEKSFIGLYSFCKLHSIKVYIMESNNVLFNDCFEKEDIIKFSNDNNSDTIHNWCFDNKMTIADELNNLSNDLHPGYFGHMEYAKKLSKFLGWGGEYPNWPDYYEFRKNLSIKQKLI